MFMVKSFEEFWREPTLTTSGMIHLATVDGGLSNLGTTAEKMIMLEIGAFRAHLHGQVSRRAFLAAGASLPLMFSANPKVSVAAENRRKARSVILLWLWGGPSQLDTFDPKPNAPADIRGPLSTIPTRTTGVRFSELFPRIAAPVRQPVGIAPLPGSVSRNCSRGLPPARIVLP